jgi:dTDP-glucose 4,6-dehydratase
MKVLCTGGLGFIGSHFVEIAEANGHEVYIIDAVAYSARSKNVAPHPWHKADICVPDQVFHHLRKFQPDAVVHFAAETHVARSIDSREEFLRTNVLGTNILLEECLTYWKARDQTPAGIPFRFLHVSTDEVYGSLGPDESPWTESSPCEPNNPYSASKAASDHLVRAYWKTLGLPVIVTHCSNNYGSRQHPEKLIPALLRFLQDGQPMALHGDGKNVRDWIHVGDHCRGLLLALEHGKVGETYNFGGECQRPNDEIAARVSEACRDAIPIQFGVVLVQDRAGNDRRYATNISKVRQELGWQPGPPIEERIAETVRWYLDHPSYGDEYGC